MIPFMQLYGVYVLIHGHYSPGGGFQAGAALAASVLLSRISFGMEESQRIYPKRLAYVLAGLGVLIYALTGLIPMLFGSWFLDYSFLPFGMDPAQLRYEGILWVEVGVVLTVTGVLIAIYDNLAEEE